MSTKTKGFSLIELMIVIAIIGVLAAIAIPSYQTYIYKARWAEMRSVGESWQSKVNAYIIESGATDCSDMQIPGAANLGLFPHNSDGFAVVQHNASPIVEQVSMNGDCRIDVLSHEGLFGNSNSLGTVDIYLQATIDETGISWTCLTTAGWAPTSCPFGNGLN